MTQQDWYHDLKSAGQWIWHNQPQTRNDTALFYARLEPPAGTTQIELHVSADNRYVLWAIADGGQTPRMPIGRGPARNDVQHTSIDSYGLHVDGRPLHLYAQVRWVPGQPEAPMGEMHTSNPGFVCIALFYNDAGQLIGKTGSGETWKAIATAGIEPTPIRDIRGFFCIGMTERQHASGWPEDWLSPQGAASPAWQAPRVGASPYFVPDPAMCFSPNDRPWLVPREIAHAEQIERSPMDVLDAASGAAVSFPLHVPAGQTRRIRVDMGQMILAYPSLRIAGKNAAVTVCYAEVLVDGKDFGRKKSFALDSGFALFGFTDTFLNDLGPSRRFTLSHWRSFRFLELEIVAGDEAATLEELFLEGTGYPFENGSSFEARGEHADAVAKLIDVSWRTLKCCTWETYMDCPFYEQMQYLGDTRLQCLITYVTTADPTLPAQALRAFDRSRIPEGITQSRFPSTGMQLIPTFSLIYILMIEDYLDWVGDEGLVAELRPGIGPILNWFNQYVDHETGGGGLITMPDYWPFVDWVSTWPAGKPPSSPNRHGKGVSSLINLHLLLALDSASRIYERAKPGSGNLYFTRANVLRQKIYDTFYHPPTGMIADVPVDHRGSPARGAALSFSQHAQALAVLGDVLKANEARKALTWAMEHAAPTIPNPILGLQETTGESDQTRVLPPQFKVARASFYFRFYLAEALAKVGMGQHLWPLLEPFRAALARGSTTWPEAFEPSRSECHAWSSWPLYFLHRHALGVHPPDSADGRVEVAPLHCPPLENVRGVTMTHRGPVTVAVNWSSGKPEVNAEGQSVHVRTHPADVRN